MRNLRAIVPLAFFVALFPVIALAQQEQSWEVQSLNKVIPGAPEGRVEYDMASGTARGTNIFVKYGERDAYGGQRHVELADRRGGGGW